MIGSRGAGEGQLERPTAVAADNEGFLYVADSGNNRIQKFDSAKASSSSPGASSGPG
jgi:DNA-binding beta-propeller fold protein YncE